VIVLDTHAFLWWQDESPRLSGAARTAIDGADRIGVPTVCCLEISTLDRRGRITLAGGPTRWLRAALADPRIEEIPLTAEIAIAAGELPETFPGDPVARVIYATSRATSSSLVTCDRRITDHDPRRVVW
jgi:PIN domain nuclease of toxin-antitoxin system